LVFRVGFVILFFHVSFFFFFSSRRRHTRFSRDWSLDVCSSDLGSLLPDLRRVFTVGEVLKRADVERLHALAPNAVCVNLYGATRSEERRVGKEWGSRGPREQAEKKAGRQLGGGGGVRDVVRDRT